VLLSRVRCGVGRATPPSRVRRRTRSRAAWATGGSTGSPGCPPTVGMTTLSGRPRPSSDSAAADGEAGNAVDQRDPAAANAAGRHDHRSAIDRRSPRAPRSLPRGSPPDPSTHFCDTFLDRRARAAATAGICSSAWCPQAEQLDDREQQQQRPDADEPVARRANPEVAADPDEKQHARQEHGVSDVVV
jgi:hypothetical protein